MAPSCLNKIVIMKFLNPSVFFLFVFIGFILFACGKGETADPPDNPSPTNYTHIIILNSNVEGAAAKVWDGGSIKKSGTTTPSGQAILAPINQQITTEYDSITLDKEGYKRWKVTNQSVGSEKTYYPNLEELAATTYNHNIAINSNVEGGDFKVWNGGSILSSGTSNSAGLANLTFVNTETSTEVDSITGKKAGYNSWKIVNQTIGENENYTATLAEIIKIMLQGQTIDLLKDIAPPYIGINSGEITEEYKSTRLEGNISFTIFNKDGSFEQLVTSDANANFSLELPAQGDYGILIDMAGKHPMMYKIIANENDNTEVIATVSDVLSLYNFAQSHMGYKPSDADETVLEANSTHSRTLNWDKTIWENGIELLFLEKTINDMTAELGEPINQEMKDLVNNMRDYIDGFTNDFFSSKNTEYVQDNSNFADDGVIPFSYKTNTSFGGTFGIATENGVVVRAAIGINKTLYDQFSTSNNQRIKALMLQENSAVTGAFFELWKENKPSIWYISIPNNMHTYTPDSKNATNTYNYLSNKLLTENTPAEGFHFPLLDSRIVNEFDNAKVQTFVQTHALPDIQQKYNNK